MITIEFIVILLCLLTGTRFGGMGLGLIGVSCACAASYLLVQTFF